MKLYHRRYFDSLPLNFFFIFFSIFFSNVPNEHGRSFETFHTSLFFFQSFFFQSFFIRIFFKWSMHRRLGGRIDSPHILARMPSILVRAKPWLNFPGIMQNYIGISMSLFPGLQVARKYLKMGLFSPPRCEKLVKKAIALEFLVH